MSRLVVLLVMLVGLVSGCTTFNVPSPHEAWKTTKKLYAEYLNPPAKVDYENKGTLSEAEMLLASRMLEIDSHLEQLERFMENQDHPPTNEVISALFQRFPWVSGLAAMDAYGEVHAQEPPNPLKPLDFTPILEQKSRSGNPRDLRVFVQDTLMGPEIYMGMPVYEDSELRGFLICHFDMRSLLGYIEDSGEIVILSSNIVLWAGHFVVGATPLVHQNWDELTKNSIEGSVSDSTGEFIWMARFLGRIPLIFATPVKGDFEESLNDAENIGTFTTRESSTSVKPEEPSQDQPKQEEQNSGDSLLLTPPPLHWDMGFEESSE